MNRENVYQRGLIRRLECAFPGCIVIKNDPNYMQGIPDLLILWQDMWAALEVKAYRQAPLQPNQEDYVLLMDSMSFAAFIYPENEGDVLDALQRAFESSGTTRVSQRQQVALDQLRCRQADRIVLQRASGQTRL